MKKWEYIPNLITSIRLLLIMPIYFSLMQRDFNLALFFFIIAGFSDGMDGIIARRYGWTSQFGAIVDPLADKLLMIVSYFCLAWLNFIPIWLFSVVVFRDLWIVMGASLYRYFIGGYEFEPTQISKLNTVCQILFVGLLLLDLTFLHLPSTLLVASMYIVLITTLSSFIDYTWVWGKKALYALRYQSNE